MVNDHVACSSLTNSEIVIPLFDDQECVKALLDIDSLQFNSFCDVDKENLEKVASYLSSLKGF